jgi:hypothetical protein
MMAAGRQEGDDRRHRHRDDIRFRRVAEGLGQDHGHRRKECGGRGIGHALRDHPDDGEQRPEDARLAPPIAGRLEPASQHVRGAALLHGRAQGDRAGDEHVEAGVDRLVGLAGPETPGEDHRHGAGQRRHLDRQEVERRHHDGRQPDPPGEGSVPTLARLAVERHQHQEGRVALHTRQSFRIALPHQHIAGAAPGVRQLLVQPPRLALQAHDEGTIPLPEVDLADRAAHEV